MSQYQIMKEKWLPRWIGKILLDIEKAKSFQLYCNNLHRSQTVFLLSIFNIMFLLTKHIHIDSTDI